MNTRPCTTRSHKGDIWKLFLITCTKLILLQMKQLKFQVFKKMKILEQCIEKFPSGPYRSKPSLSYKLPAGSYYAQTETAKGIYGTYIIAEKGDKPHRIHTRSPSFANLMSLNEMSKGHKVSDLVTIMATLDPVIPEIDR